MAKNPPPPRYGHSACIIESKMYIFGGWGQNGLMNDLYCLDLGLKN